MIWGASSQHPRLGRVSLLLNVCSSDCQALPLLRVCVFLYSVLMSTVYTPPQNASVCFSRLGRTCVHNLYHSCLSLHSSRPLRATLNFILPTPWLTTFSIVHVTYYLFASGLSFISCFFRRTRAYAPGFALVIYSVDPVLFIRPGPSYFLHDFFICYLTRLLYLLLHSPRPTAYLLVAGILLRGCMRVHHHEMGMVACRLIHFLLMARHRCP